MIYNGKQKLLALTTALVLNASLALAAPQTTCPVMGGQINKDLHADYKGQRVYFCCPACPPVFAKDPQKYIDKMKKMGQEPEQVPVQK